MRGKWRKRNKKRKQSREQVYYIIFSIVGILVLCIGMKALEQFRQKHIVTRVQVVENVSKTSQIVEEPELLVELLTPNPYSRPQKKLKKVEGIVIHYTANPGTTAKQNRDYFEGLKDTKQTKASSHFIIGLEGEIIQCIPSNEIAYASNERNADTLSIECCHPDETGVFTKKTYQSLLDLTAWLCEKFGVETEKIIRHYDVTGKMCPLYYVEHPDDWKQFLEDVEDNRRKYGEE